MVTTLDAAETARWRQVGDQVTRDMEKEQRVSSALMTALRAARAKAN